MNLEPTVFSKIINRELPAEIVFENERIIVITNIEPKAPIHLLAITKIPFHNLHELIQDEDNKDLLWEIFSILGDLAKQMNIDKSGYRLVSNCGVDAGQSVPHLHVHLLGGKRSDMDNL